ncbi:Gastricsin [Dactylella cylindrospora]|nr:Gastricsin [Dactylella cylindrospora]
MQETHQHSHSNSSGTYMCDSNGICNIDAVQKNLDNVLAVRIAEIFKKDDDANSVTASTNALVSVALPVVDTVGKWAKKPEDQEDPDDILRGQEEYEYGMRPRAAFLDLYSEVQNLSEPSNYYTEFCVGYDGPTFKFEIDSGSTLLWVQARMSSRDVIPEGQNAYNVFDDENDDFGPQLRFATNVRNQVHSYAKFRITYSLYQDRFNVGAMVAEGQKIGAVAISSLPKENQKRKFEGILGLGPENPNDLTEEDLAVPSRNTEVEEGETGATGEDTSLQDENPDTVDEDANGASKDTDIVDEDSSASNENLNTVNQDTNESSEDSEASQEDKDSSGVEERDGMSPNLIRNLKRQGMVDAAVMTMIGPRVDHKFMPKPEGGFTNGMARGYLAIGPAYAEYVDGQVVWCDLLQDQNQSPESAWSRGRWVVKLNQIIINNKVEFENQYALIDTGTAYIITSDPNFNKMVDITQGSRAGNSLFTYNKESLQSISFAFDRGTLNLSPEDFSIGETAGKTRHFSCITKAPSAGSLPKNIWILGGAFLDNMVTIFDYDHRRVGFANIPDKDFKDFSMTL